LFPVPSSNGAPGGITAGPDGNLWFTEFTAGFIGEINPTTHVIAEFPIQSTVQSLPSGITAGPDGNLWFAEFGTNQIGVINPTTHAIAEFPIPSAISRPSGIASGPDGNLWFTEGHGNKIGRIVSTAPSTAPDLSLSGDVPASVTLGTSVTDTLTVTNDGTGAATGVVLTDTLPPGVTFVSATGGATPVNGVLTVQIGDLAAGASVQFTIVVTPTAAGALQNQASVSGDETDPTPADNSVTQVTTVTQASTATPTVNADGPIVTSVERFGARRQPDGLVVTFNEPLDPAPAQDAANYVLYALGGRRGLLSRKYSHITIRSAALDANGPSVVLSFAGGHLKRRGIYQLVVKGTPNGGLTGLDGRYLDGREAGQPGTDYVTILYGKNLVGSGPGRGHRGTTPPGAPSARPVCRPSASRTEGHRARVALCGPIL
jgi:uncharacterized repeat protein (TIGR01451 family)